jgi:mono/diheme cytochrome c family protein
VGCHGARGLGDGPLSAALGVRPIAGRPFAGEADVALLRVGAGRMPGFGDLLDAGDAARVLSWLSRLDPATGLLAGESAEDAAAPPPPEGEGAEEDGEGGG